MMDGLERIPAKGDQFSCQDVTFTVEETELNRVTRILAEK